MSKNSKYAYRHINVYVREDTVLKKKSLDKPIDQLKASDFKKSFVKMFWKKLYLKGISDRDGKNMSEEDVRTFFDAIHK